MEDQKVFKNELIFGNSRGEISRATGISKTHLSKIFSGSRNPSLDCARKISAYLGISTDDLCFALSSVPKSSIGNQA
jgi:transcriptional regulator with XRE-family HTH domain